MSDWISTGNVILPSQEYTNRVGEVVRMSDANGNEFIKLNKDK